MKGARARGRDEASEQALAAAFDKDGAERVTRLYWRDDLPAKQGRCALPDSVKILLSRTSDQIQGFRDSVIEQLRARFSKGEK